MEAGGKRYIIHKSKTDEFTIWDFSCLHLLSALCAENDLRRDINTVLNDPHAYWFGGGDYADYIGVNDVKRFDPACVSKQVTVADLGDLGRYSVDTVYKWLSPIKHKCLGMIFGNHEYQYQKRNHQQNLHGLLCQKMGVANLGYSAYVSLTFVRWATAPESELGLRTFRGKIPKSQTSSSQFWFYLHHGAGGATTHGGKINRLEKFMNDHTADVYMIGHVHDKGSRQKPRTAPNANGTSIRETMTVGVISGSYLRTYQTGVTSYGEIQGYSPVLLGASWVRIQPETRRIWTTI